MDIITYVRIAQHPRFQAAFLFSSIWGDEKQSFFTKDRQKSEDWYDISLHHDL